MSVVVKGKGNKVALKHSWDQVEWRMRWGVIRTVWSRMETRLDDGCVEGEFDRWETEWRPRWMTEPIDEDETRKRRVCEVTPWIPIHSLMPWCVIEHWTNHSGYLLSGLIYPEKRRIASWRKGWTGSGLVLRKEKKWRNHCNGNGDTHKVDSVVLRGLIVSDVVELF